MIAAFLWFGRRLGNDVEGLVRIVAWASVIGALLQFLAQFPTVLRLEKHLRFRLDHRRESVRKVLKGFGPIAISRGATQISAFIDLWIANKLPTGAPTLLMTAQTVTLLPISIFGMAISNAEMPGMSSVVGTSDERTEAIRERLAAAARRISFFVIPSAIAFFAMGDVIVRVLYERGRFTALDTMFTWGILACAAVGLLANTLARLYSTAFYAMHDTKRPFRIALIRIAASIVMGYLAAVPLTNALDVDRRWGAAALSLAASTAGWLEFALLRDGLRQRLGRFSVPRSYALRLWAIAAIAAVTARGVELLSESWGVGMRPTLQSVLHAALILGTFGLVYLALAVASRLPEANALVSRFRRR
jgi:putative peptidoglycan lipid II flippase